MANGNLNTKLGGCIFILIVLSQILSNGCVDGRRITTLKIKELVKHKGTIKTIKAKDGDVIDCVDIYKQPAFDHPLLKNHTVQIKPSSYPTGLQAEKFQAELFQGWLKDGQCPEGTVPIRRTKIISAHRKAIPSIPQRNHKTEIEASTGHEYAQVSVIGGKYFGAQAYIDVWHPTTYDGEFSVAQIWVYSGQEKELNSVEAGWMVYSGENQTKFFTYWTRDGYQNTGCYDLACPGFVQTNNKIALGSPIHPVSTFGAKQFVIGIKIHKDKESGHWWLQLQDQALGYWPSSIFTSLTDSSTAINWGGEILNLESQGQHTSTQMGSGHFPNEDYGKASYFRNLGYIDNSGAVKDPENLIPYVSKSTCYDLHVKNKNNDYGTHFYFGGPGYSETCQ